MAYWVRRPNVRKLQAFGASLIWRAGTTTRPEMSVTLDTTTLERARRVVQGDEASYFAIIGMRCEAGELSGFVARPTLFLDEAPARGVQFYMNGVVLNIFLSPPSTEPEASALLLGQRDDWLIGYVPLQGSKYAETISDICRQIDYRAITP